MRHPYYGYTSLGYQDKVRALIRLRKLILICSSYQHVSVIKRPNHWDKSGWHPWTELCAEEDGSFTENSDTGKAERSQQLYELMREQSTVGGASIGNIGGRAYESNPEDPTTTTRLRSQL